MSDPLIVALRLSLDDVDALVTSQAAKIITQAETIIEQATRHEQDNATIAGLTTRIDDLTAQLTACQDALHPPGMRAVITLNGFAYVYDSAGGTDLGDFAGPGFVQRCLRVTRTDCDIVVHFRPDRSSSRREVVFELSSLGFPGLALVDLPAYSVVISEAGATLATITVPKHFWYSRWRWQSAPRPEIRFVAEMTNAGLLPRYAPTGINVTTTPKQAAYTVMGLAGIYPGMPTTGERDDIGPVTENQGYYLVTGKGLDSVLAQAEAAATLPMHRRLADAPLSFDLDPLAQWLGKAGAGHWYPDSGATGIILDCAHFPALSYLPYLLTGDPYFLEELQFEATQNVGQSNPSMAAGYRNGSQCLFRQDQTRSYAWTMRSFMQLAAVCPETVPSWLLPRSYWQAKLANNLAHFMSAWVNQTDPVRQMFRVGPIATAADAGIGQWQDDFVLFIVLWAIRLGHTEWQPIADWFKAALLARTGNASGWPRSYPAVYYQTYLQQPSWAASWAATKAALALADPPADGSLAPGQSWGYAAYARGALALLGGGPEYQWLHNELVRVRRGSYWKWQVVP